MSLREFELSSHSSHSPFSYATVASHSFLRWDFIRHCKPHRFYHQTSQALVSIAWFSHLLKCNDDASNFRWNLHGAFQREPRMRPHHLSIIHLRLFLLSHANVFSDFLFFFVFSFWMVVVAILRWAKMMNVVGKERRERLLWG